MLFTEQLRSQARFRISSGEQTSNALTGQKGRRLQPNGSLSRLKPTCGYNTEESTSNSVSENHVMLTWAQVLTVMVNAQVRSSLFRLVTAVSVWIVWKNVPRITLNDSASSMFCTGMSTLSLTWCHVSCVYHRVLNGALHNYRYPWGSTVKDLLS